MRYTLVTKRGKVMKFYIKSMAEMYQQSHGGEITETPQQPLRPPKSLASPAENTRELCVDIKS